MADINHNSTHTGTVVDLAVTQHIALVGAGYNGNIALGADPADAGRIRLSNADVIAWEDATECTLTHVDDTGLSINLALDVVGALTAGTLATDTTLVMPAAGKIHLDGSTGGNTHLSELNPDDVRLVVGGATAIQATATHISLDGTTFQMAGTTANMVASGTILTVGVGADNGTVSAGIFTDRTKGFEGDALSELNAIKTKDGQLDHDSLPAFTKINVKKDIIEEQEQDAEVEVDGKPVIQRIKTQVKVGERFDEERDIGATLSMVQVALKQLTDRVEALEP